MCNTLIMRRLYAVIGFGLLITAALLLFTTSTVWAYPCDDNYAEQQDRESCWWRFWNDQSTPEDKMMSDGMMGSMFDGMVCDTHYTAQQDRENCWWRYHNGLSPIEVQPMMADDMMGDKMMSDGMMKSQADGMVCNTHNSMQKNRENCWWRFHNGLPLITELQIMSDDMMMGDDKMMSNGM